MPDHAALAAAAAAISSPHAGGADIVIACAGISHGTLTERPEDLAVFEHVVRHQRQRHGRHLRALHRAMKAQSGTRRLVGIGSVAGMRGMRGAGAYSASKAAVRQLLRIAAARNATPRASGW